MTIIKASIATAHLTNLPKPNSYGLDQASTLPPTCRELAAAFAALSLSAFGGALPWARHILVERRGWLNAEEFTETLAFCQILPGPNIVNIAIAVGARFQGARGAVAALLGLILPAFCIVIALGALYARYGGLDILHGLFIGVAAAAAGLIVAMTAKMAVPLLSNDATTSLPFMASAFIMVGLLRWPLGWVLLGLAPLSIAAAWWRKR